MKQACASGSCLPERMMLERLRGSSPVKEDAQMEQFLLDVAAQVVAGVIVALFVYLIKRR